MMMSAVSWVWLCSCAFFLHYQHQMHVFIARHDHTCFMQPLQFRILGKASTVALKRRAFLDLQLM